MSWNVARQLECGDNVEVRLSWECRGGGGVGWILFVKVRQIQFRTLLLRIAVNRSEILNPLSSSGGNTNGAAAHVTNDTHRQARIYDIRQRLAFKL